MKASSTSSSTSSWQTAIDPNTKRMYFYNKGTKETTWTKPLQLCTSDEKEERLRIKGETVRFFTDMEDRIHQKIHRADKGDDTEYSVPPLDELPGLGADAVADEKVYQGGRRPYRPRTISSLDGTFTSVRSPLRIANLFPSEPLISFPQNRGSLSLKRLMFSYYSHHLDSPLLSISRLPFSRSHHLSNHISPLVPDQSPTKR